jgi:tetratricopeptide (TPR) repeat protein
MSAQDAQQIVGFQDTSLDDGSYELRQIMSTVSAYIDLDLLDDAEDLLQEITDLAVTDREVAALFERFRLARGRTGGTKSARDVSAAATSALVSFTQPLPGVEELARPAQRLVTQVEQDYRAGHLQAALDGSLRIASLYPGFFANHVRIAELLVLQGDLDGAERLTETLRWAAETARDTSSPMLQSLSAALRADLDSLIDHARALLAEGSGLPLEPMVPAVIERVAADRPEIAVELAEEFLRQRPGHNDVTRLYLLTLLSTDHTSADSAFRTTVSSSTSEADLLYLRAAVALSSGEDDALSWLERVANSLRDAPDHWPAVLSVIDASEARVPTVTRILWAAILSLAANDLERAVTLLDEWETFSLTEAPISTDQFIAACTRACAAEGLGLTEQATEAIEEALVLIDGGEVAALAKESLLFGTPRSHEQLVEQYQTHLARGADTDRQLVRLRELKERIPSSIPLQELYLETLVHSGRVNEAVREMRSIAQEHERAGNVRAMVTTMRRISEAVPDNAEIKSMLVDAYRKRGVLDEAMRELELLGDLQARNNEGAAAAQSYGSAAEIAWATGSFRRGSDLYEKATSIDGDNIAVRHAAAAYFLQVGSIEQAIQNLKEIVRISLAAHDLDEAVASLHQIIGLIPEEPDAYLKLGEVLTTMGEYGQAERVFRRLSVLLPNDPVLLAKQSALAVLAATQ